MSGWSALYKQGNKVFITSKLPNHSVVCRFIKYRSLIWPWLVAISLCFLHNFSRLSRLSYKLSYQRSWRIWNYCSHEAYSMLCKSIFQCPENWQISALSYPAITTLMNLIAYTKKYNKWSQKHSIQLWLGENNIFYLSWQQTQNKHLDSCCTWASYSLAAHALQILNVWEKTSKCCQLLFPFVIRKIISYNGRWKVKKCSSILYYSLHWWPRSVHSNNRGKDFIFFFKRTVHRSFQSSCPVRTG